MKTGLIIGSGRQSEAVINFLLSTDQYRLLVLTRSTTSTTDNRLKALPNVELVKNNVQTGYDVQAFLAAANRSDFVFLNLDGFALGEQADTYWGIRLFELATRANVKHLIYSGLDYNGKESHFDPIFYVGHCEGKAKVQEFIHAQSNSSMAWTILRTGPYIENLTQLMAPVIDNDGTYLFKLPLEAGAIPFIHLEDLGGYVHWALANPEISYRMDVGIATAHVSGSDIATAFTSTTGKAARYISISTDEWNKKTWKKLPNGSNTKIGFLTVKDDNALLQTYGENFANWWHIYQASSSKFKQQRINQKGL